MVFKTLMEVGIPVTKLQSPRFVALIENAHQSLGGQNGVRQMQPVLQELVMDCVKVAVAGRLVSITFDGSKVNFAIEGMLARFLNDDHMPTVVCAESES